MRISAQTIGWIAALLLSPTIDVLAADAPGPAVGLTVGDTVEVQFRRGHTVHGIVSPRTDDSRLWLIANSIGIRLESGYRWTEVRTVVSYDVSFVPLDPPPDPVEVFPELGHPPGPLHHVPFLPETTMSYPYPDHLSHHVRSLAVDAIVENLDADSDIDGLLVRVSPRDRQGQVVPIAGRLRLRLVVEAHPPLQRRSQLSNRQTRVIGRWSRSLCPEDFTPTGAIIPLPIRRDARGNDERWPYARLEATLSIPGRGTFDATSAIVSLNPQLLGPVPIDPQLQDLDWD